MTNILVTGSYGQLGTEIKLLSDRYPQYNFMFTDVDSLDITDRLSVAEFVTGNDVRYILNCAAYTAVDKAETDRRKCETVNAVAVRLLAKVARDAGCGMLHISTDYVFDGHTCHPYTEESTPRPLSVYGMTKRKGEKVLLHMYPEAIVLRTSWLYSPYGSNFVKTMRKLGRERKELSVVYDQVGTPTYARDLAKAVLTVMHRTMKPGHGLGGLYHYSDEGVCSWYDFARKIHELSGIKGCKITPILSDQYPTVAKRPTYSVLDKSKFKRTFGLEIPHWEDSLKHCVRELTRAESAGADEGE